MFDRVLNTPLKTIAADIIPYFYQVRLQPVSNNRIGQPLTFLSDCNGTRTHNHLVRKRTLIMAIFAEQLSVCL